MAAGATKETKDHSKRSENFKLVITVISGAIVIAIVLLVSENKKNDQKKYPPPSETSVPRDEVVHEEVIEVDFDRSLQKAIAAGGYRAVNRNITEANFPPGKDEKGKRKVSFVIFQFSTCDGEEITSEEATQRMEARSCCPASLRKSLAFGEISSKVRGQFPKVVVLGAVYVAPNGDYQALTLLSLYDGDKEVRDLSFRPLDYKWHPDSHFLGVKQ